MGSMDGPQERESTLPVGYRFSPTEPELINHYLKGKIAGQVFENAVREVDVFRHDPWDLPAQSAIKSDDCRWYFFTLLNYKYNSGKQSNRATPSGYWKKTGSDRRVRSCGKVIGIKKNLVFFTGRTPNGQKTPWVIHEYHLPDKTSSSQRAMVLCLLKKKNNEQTIDEDGPNSVMLSNPGSHVAGVPSGSLGSHPPSFAPWTPIPQDIEPPLAEAFEQPDVFSTFLETFNGAEPASACQDHLISSEISGGQTWSLNHSGTTNEEEDILFVNSLLNDKEMATTDVEVSGTSSRHACSVHSERNDLIEEIHALSYHETLDILSSSSDSSLEVPQVNLVKLRGGSLPQARSPIFPYYSKSRKFLCDFTAVSADSDEHDLCSSVDQSPNGSRIAESISDDRQVPESNGKKTFQFSSSAPTASYPKAPFISFDTPPSRCRMNPKSVYLFNVLVGVFIFLAIICHMVLLGDWW